MNSYYTIVILFCIIVLLFNFREIKQAKLLQNKVDKKWLVATQIVLFLGVLLRLVYLQYPYGINYDEAIAGYDAWCIANYGVDQHLMSYPVYLKSWGSGQSALYAYLSAPLIQLFGLSLPVHRLPMAMVSSASIILFYYTMRKIGLRKFFVFLAILFLVFNPWHFTKSRWALDCNLAPDLVLIGTCFVILTYYGDVYRKQIRSLVLGFLFFGIAAYGYAVAWFMLPIYSLLIFAFLYRNKKISLKQMLVTICIVTLVTAPLILFAFQLTTGGDALSVGPLTIPKLNAGRHETASIISLGMSELPTYLSGIFKSLATGYDYLLSNSFPYTGQFYNPIGWIFILLTFVFFIWRKELNVLDIFFLFWLIACIPIILFVAYNVNRWNLIWFPLIYFCVRGIDLCIAKRTIPKVIFALAFAFLTSIFALNYKMIHAKAFLPGIEESVKTTSSKKMGEVYFIDNVQYPAIMFYDPISPYILNETKVELDKSTSFIFLKQFGKYKIGVPSIIEPRGKTAYVIPNQRINDYRVDFSKFEIEKNDTYTILWNE